MFRAINKNFVIAAAMLFSLCTPSFAISWSWVVNNTSSTYTGIESDSGNTVTGTFTRLSNGFLEFDVGVSSSGPNIPSIGSDFYPIEVPGFFLAIPPVLDFETQMTPSVEAGSCPGGSQTYNFIYAGWSSTSDTSNASQAALGYLTWNVAGSQIEIGSIFNVSSYAKPSWFIWNDSNPLDLATGTCSGGVAAVNGPPNSDRSGTLYLSSDGGLVYSTDANNVILGFPQAAISSTSDLQGLYAAYNTKLDSGDTVSNNNRPFRAVITAGVDSRADTLTDIPTDTLDTGYGTLRLSVDEINSPASGMFRATLTRSGSSGQYGCIYHNTGSANLILCAGQNDANNALPANLLLAEQSVPDQSISCDSGAASTTCTITSAENIPANDLVTFNNLVIGSGGSVNAASGATISVVGDITIQNGGSMTGDYDEIVADDFNIDSGGTFTGNITDSYFKNVTIADGGTLSAVGQGSAGGVNGAAGSGTCGGDASSNGGAGGCHGGNGGRGEDSTASTGTYGSNTTPITAGSGGGAGDGTGYNGGAGGGVIRLNVSNRLEVEGIITASGDDGTDGATSGNDGAGGGSGGSIYITTNTLAGTGRILANGGKGGDDGTTGDKCGGGGGGGRISITYSDGGFIPDFVKANGGNANCNVSTLAEAGSAGTIYWSPTEPTFSPKSINNLRMWVDADDSSTLFTNTGCTSAVGSDGDSVACWKDKSENENHLIQTDGSYTPVRATESGKTVVEFTSDGLTSGSDLFDGSTLTNGSEIFIVARVRDTSNNFAFLAGADPPRWGAHIPYSGSTIYSDMGGTCCGNRVNGAWGAGTSEYYLWGMNGSTTGGHSIRRNRSEILSGSNLSSPTVSGSLNLAMGSPGSSHWQANIAEVIIYEKQLDSDERELIEDYLWDKWSLAVPAGDLLIWLDANDINGDGSSFTDAADVTTWNDLSGNGYHATEINASNSPTYDSDGFNLNPSVLIDNGDNGFRFTSMSHTADEYTIFFVGEQDTGNYLLDSSDGGNRFLLSLGTDGFFYDGSWRTPVPNFVNKTVASWLFDDGASPEANIWINGIDQGSSYTGYTLTSLGTNLTLADRFSGETVTYFDGQISEFIVYEKAMNDTERRAIEESLWSKWDMAKDPTDFSNLEIWLDASDINGDGTPFTDGADVVTWYDKSGNSNHAKQMSSSNSPHYDSDGFNSLPTVVISTSDRGLQFDSLVSSSGDYTVFVVGREDNPASTYSYLLDLNGTSRWVYSYNNDGYGLFYLAGSWTGNGPGNTSNILTSLVLDDGAGTEVRFFINGVLDDSSGSYNAMTLDDTLTLGDRYVGGANSRFGGVISELIIYNTAISDSDREDIEASLMFKWDITP